MQRLIAAGVLRADGTELDMEAGEEGLEFVDVEVGDEHEEEAVGGEEACLLLTERLGFDYVRKAMFMFVFSGFPNFPISGFPFLPPSVGGTKGIPLSIVYVYLSCM